ncbi:MAG: fumarylacetoacetate hydrolase family protein [Rhizobiaceae bacterium]|nr:fumarylacetoacetate hydrolase family protein [Rhizobiaceae bacterium]
MTQYVFEPAPVATVAVAGAAARFPVRRILCVGRNYAEHAREMGGNPEREPPFFFTKPADAVVDSGVRIPYPALTKNLHHEIELVVAIGKGGADIAPADALSHVWGYGVGIDLTRRDLQDAAKKAARPWDWSKGFDRSAPCSPLVPAARVTQPLAGRIWLAVDGVVKQDGRLEDLIWPVPDIVAIASQGVELRPGDLIFTGTPAGVGPVPPGSLLTGGIDGIGTIDISIGGA